MRINLKYNNNMQYHIILANKLFGIKYFHKNNIVKHPWDVIRSNVRYTFFMDHNNICDL